MIDTKPPENLSDSSQTIWKTLMAEYELSDSAGQLLLKTALECRDRMLEAQALIDAEGLEVKDRFGQKRANPLLNVEKDARSAMMAAIKQLGLDLEPLKPGPGRPGG